MLVFILQARVKPCKSYGYVLFFQDSVHAISKIGGMLELHLKDGLFFIDKGFIIQSHILIKAMSDLVVKRVCILIICYA